MVDKSERSAKKLRRRMQKDMKNQLYSRFVKSGTLQGKLIIIVFFPNDNLQIAATRVANTLIMIFLSNSPAVKIQYLP